MNQIPDDFETWWTLPANWVEAPNQRRSGWSGMMKATIAGETYFIKKQRNHLYHTLRHPFGLPTTVRELKNITRLHALGIGAPTLVFHGSRHNPEGAEGLLVTRELDGYISLDQLKIPPPELRMKLAVLAGDLIGKMHAAGLQHCCLYDKHLMVNLQQPEPRLALIDLEKMRSPLLKARGAKRDLDQLHRHQKLWNEAEWQALVSAHQQANP